MWNSVSELHCKIHQSVYSKNTLFYPSTGAKSISILYVTTCTSFIRFRKKINLTNIDNWSLKSLFL